MLGVLERSLYLTLFICGLYHSCTVINRICNGWNRPMAIITLFKNAGVACVIVSWTRAGFSVDF
jgi:hypothetical protein